jgi:ankyrin repeat protein
MKSPASSLVILLIAAQIVSGRGEDDSWEKARKQYEENVRIAALHPVEELRKAIEDGDVKEVTQLLDEGCPASVPMPLSQDDYEGLPPTDFPILLAISHGRIEIVRLLLDRGASPKTMGFEIGTTPLHHAKDIEIAKLLISRGADVNARDGNGDQPIHNATVPGYIENGNEQAVANSLALIKFLIEKGADPLAENDQKMQPIHIAAIDSTAEVVSFFLNHNANVDATTQSKEGNFYDGWQLIHFAAARSDTEGSLKIAELLISKGANVNATTAAGSDITMGGESPLHLSKLPAMTKLLLSHKAKVDIMSTGLIKKQPIHHFAMEGDVESLKMLLDHGADIEARSESGETTTPLDTAVYWERADAVKFLLERGAKPTERVMMNALRFGNSEIDILRILHQHGGIVSADVFLKQHPQSAADLLPMLNQENKDLLLKQSARLIAESAATSYRDESEGGLAAIRALVALGAKADQPWEGLLPIHHTVISGKEAVIDYLISLGQPIDAKGTFTYEDADPPIKFTDVQLIHLAGFVHWSGFNPVLIPYLIRKGAKIDAVTGEGWQPIHLAAAHGNAEILKVIIASGGNPKAKTTDGKTPLQLAKEFANKESVEYLEGLP